MTPTYVKAACRCGLNTFNVAFPPPPASPAVDMCHCNMCRHSTGQMYVHTRTFDGVPLSPSGGPGELKNLVAYKASPRLTRYSCSKCGAFMFDSVLDKKDESSSGVERWSVTSGVLDAKQVEEVVKVDHHAYVEDTLDGGIADHYPRLDGVDLARYKTSQGNGETLPRGWKADRLIQLKDKPLTDTDTLSLNCHCRAVDIYITAPPSITNPEKEWWLVPPESRSTTDAPWPRYLASHCVCESCRLSSGSIIQSFMFVPLSNIIDKHTSKPIILLPGISDSSERQSNLHQYESSPGIFREYCATCRATVFYWRTSRNPMVIDISVGLLDQEQEGARAERWLGWSKSVDFSSDAVDLAGLGALEEGLKGHK